MQANGVSQSGGLVGSYHTASPQIMVLNIPLIYSNSSSGRASLLQREGSGFESLFEYCVDRQRIKVAKTIGVICKWDILLQPIDNL